MKGRSPAMTLSAAVQVAATAAALYVTALVSVRLAGRRTVSQPPCKPDLKDIVADAWDFLHRQR